MPSDQFKVSVCVTTYNHEQYIAQALDSILAQQCDFEFQVVISDDRSTDGTQAIIRTYAEKHPQRIKAILNKTNRGVAGNFFYTISECDAEYIAILDGDDIMLPEKLQIQSDYLDHHPDCVIVSHEVRAFDSDTGKTLYYMTSPDRSREKFTVEDLISHGNFISAPSKMFRKSSMPENGVDPNIKLVADWYLSIENSLKGKIGFIPRCLSEYRCHAASYMRSINGENHFKVVSYVLDSLEKRFPGRYSHLFRRNWAYAYLVYTIHNINQGHFAEARKTIRRSLRSKPFYSLSQYYYLTWAFLPFLGFILRKFR